MSVNLFIILWLAGLVGVLSLWWIPLSIPGDEALTIPLWGIKIISLLQPTILLSIAVLIGVILSSKVGLSAPLAEAISCRKSISLALNQQLLPGVVGGVFGTIVLITNQLLWKLFLPLDFWTKAEVLSNNTSFLTRILYGGITEELLLRWGLMTFFVWVGWRVFQKGQGKPSTVYFTTAIALSAIIFALGHLPIVVALGSQITVSVMAYIILGNSLFGFIAGYLYWSKGLESAMIAHMVFHTIVVVVGVVSRSNFLQG